MPPNIVVFFSDDHAQWALPSYGNREINAPNLTHLADTGVLMQNASHALPGLFTGARVLLDRPLPLAARCTRPPGRGRRRCAGYRLAGRHDDIGAAPAVRRLYDSAQRQVALRGRRNSQARLRFLVQRLAQDAQIRQPDQQIQRSRRGRAAVRDRHADHHRRRRRLPAGARPGYALLPLCRLRRHAQSLEQAPGAPCFAVPRRELP